MPIDEHKKSAAELAFDVTRQFLTLAFGGIAFVVGLSFSSPDAVSQTFLWWTIGLFSASAVFGLLVLMNGVGKISEESTFDIYSSSLRLFSIVQILLIIAGTALLIPIVSNGGSANEQPTANIEISNGGSESISYPIDPASSYEVEVTKDKISIKAEPLAK